MSATDHGEHLTQVTYLRVFNCYLIREDDGLTLVDTGPAGAKTEILRQISRLGQPLTRIVLTHAHSDHVAGLDQLIAAVGEEPEIVVGRRESLLLAGDFATVPGEPHTPVKSRSYGSPQTRPTRLVDDGDRLGSLQVIATPGHTPGHISLLDTRDRTLLAGDAILTQGRVAVSGDFVLSWPFPALVTWHKPTAVVSARRLLETHPDRLATGHGPVLKDPGPKLREAIANHQAVPPATDTKPDDAGGDADDPLNLRSSDAA